MTINIKSWRTGAAAFILVVVGIIQGAHQPSLKAALEDPSVQLSIISAAGLALAKDYNVTGGTVGQPSTPQALADANQAPAVGPAAPVPAPAPAVHAVDEMAAKQAAIDAQHKLEGK